MGILTDIHVIRLIVFAVLDIVGVVVRPVLASRDAMCGFYALVAPKSHFPQGEMAAIATGFFVLLVIYEMITYAIKPKTRPDA